MKGFPAWPGRVSHTTSNPVDAEVLKNSSLQLQIVEPTDALRKAQRTEKSKCIYFFGSHNQYVIRSFKAKFLISK